MLSTKIKGGSGGGTNYVISCGTILRGGGQTESKGGEGGGGKSTTWHPRVLPRNSLRDVERVLLYGPNIHIKAYCPSTLPHQRKISDEGMLDRHAL